MVNTSSSVDGVEPQLAAAIDEGGVQEHQTEQAGTGGGGNGSNNESLSNDEGGGDQPAKSTMTYPVTSRWRPVLERPVDRPNLSEFPILTPAEESTIEQRGRNSAKSPALYTSTLPALHSEARNMLGGNMNGLVLELRRVSHIQDFLMRVHRNVQGSRSLSTDDIGFVTFEWMHLDRRARPALAAAALNRELCTEFLARPYIAGLLSSTELWAPFPGCPPNGVQLAKRRRMQAEYRRYYLLQTIKGEMEAAAETVKTLACGLYRIQIAFYATIAFFRPDYFAFEDPGTTELADMDGAWTVEKEGEFVLELMEMLKHGEDGVGQNTSHG